MVSHFQFDVLSSQLGHGGTKLDRAVDEVVDPPLLQRVPTRETEGLLLHNQIPRLCSMALAAIAP